MQLHVTSTQLKETVAYTNTALAKYMQILAAESQQWACVRAAKLGSSKNSTAGRGRLSVRKSTNLSKIKTLGKTQIRKGVCEELELLEDSVSARWRHGKRFSSRFAKQ